MIPQATGSLKNVRFVEIETEKEGRISLHSKYRKVQQGCEDDGKNGSN